jgi:hypothetical protein
MAMSDKERQAKRRKKLADRGISTVTVPWPHSCPHAELYLVGEFLIANPDCSFVPCYRDARGRLYTLRENRG